MAVVFAGEALGHLSGQFFNPCVHAVEKKSTTPGGCPATSRLSAFVQLCASAEAQLNPDTERLDEKVVGPDCARRFADKKATKVFSGREFMHHISSSRISSNFPREP
jgi:hypothetical protein